MWNGVESKMYCSVTTGGPHCRLPSSPSQACSLRSPHLPIRPHGLITPTPLRPRIATIPPRAHADPHQPPSRLDQSLTRNGTNLSGNQQAPRPSNPSLFIDALPPLINGPHRRHATLMVLQQWCPSQPTYARLTHPTARRPNESGSCPDFCGKLTNFSNEWAPQVECNTGARTSQAACATPLRVIMRPPSKHAALHCTT